MYLFGSLLNCPFSLFNFFFVFGKTFFVFCTLPCHIFSAEMKGKLLQICICDYDAWKQVCFCPCSLSVVLLECLSGLSFVVFHLCSLYSIYIDKCAIRLRRGINNYISTFVATFEN